MISSMGIINNRSISIISILLTICLLWLDGHTKYGGMCKRVLKFLVSCLMLPVRVYQVSLESLQNTLIFFLMILLWQQSFFRILPESFFLGRYNAR